MAAAVTTTLAPVPIDTVHRPAGMGDALLDPVVVAAVEQVLADAGIRHGRLVAGEANLNANLTDRSHVFVKVTRPGSGPKRLRNELVSSSWARTHGITAPEPLLGQVVGVVDAYGRVRHVIVHRWLDVGHRPGLVDRAFDALDAIVALDAVPAPPQAEGYDLGMYVRRVRRRLAGRFDCVATEVIAHAEDTWERCSAGHARRSVRWSHCDLHLDNFGWMLNGRAAVLDWESAAIAPVEVDVAQLLRSIEVYHPDHDPTQRRELIAQVAASADARLDLDWDLVRDTIRFRSASAASQLLSVGERPRLLRSNIELLRRDEAWFPFPG